MTSPPITPEDDLLVAEYVLGVLPHAERVALARRLADDAALADRARFWEGELAPLGESAAEVAPPPGVLDSVERRLFPQEERPAGLWHSLAFWRGLAAVLFCGLLLGGGLAVMRIGQQGGTPATAYVAEVAGDAKAIRLVAFYDAATGVLKLNRLDGSAAAGRDFELWLVAENAPPVSLGVLPRAALSTVKLPAAAAARLGPKAVLAVSDEPAGGSPTGQPTGAVLATGSLAPI